MGAGSGTPPPGRPVLGFGGGAKVATSTLTRRSLGGGAIGEASPAQALTETSARIVAWNASDAPKEKEWTENH